MIPSKLFPVRELITAPQGLHSKTWTPPPLDGSLTIVELFEWNANHSPDHPYYTYYHDGQKRIVCNAEIWRAMKRVARLECVKYLKDYHSRYEAQEGERPKDRGPTIGILASADTISYNILMLSLARLGYVPFPISTRNSPAAVAQLISEMHVIQVFVSPDNAMQNLISRTNEILGADRAVQRLSMVQFHQVSDAGYEFGYEFEDNLDVFFPKPQLDRIFCVFHSSGSSSFPKPISFYNHMFLRLAMIPYYGDLDLSDLILAIHTAPVFHAMGLATLAWPPVTGLIMGVFPPQSPPMLPTSENFLRGIVETKADIIMCVPSFIEAWFQDPASIDILKYQNIRSIVYAGAPLNKQVGEELIKMGIALFPSYGSTETGTVSKFLPAELPTLDKWEYFQISPHMDVRMQPWSKDGVFEIVCVQTSYYVPNVINYENNGEIGYRTGDLVQQHPSDSNSFRIFGRADDQIVLVTGEKTNPVPLEAILLQDPNIAGCVLFGHGQPQNGVLVELKRKMERDAAIEEIWPSVEKMNAYAPTHSRIVKEFILFTTPRKPLEYTPKGTARSKIAIKLYTEEIEHLYDKAASGWSDLPVTSRWDLKGEMEVRALIRAIILRIMRAEQEGLQDDMDLFQNGCDSLQATYIFRAISQSLKSSNIQKDLPKDLVYLYPTISSLVTFLISAPSSTSTSHEDTMRTLLSKYTTLFPAHSGTLDLPSEEILIVTGTTGHLGSHILSQLLQNPNVKRVYALNRPESKHKQGEAFTTGGYPSALLDSNKLVCITADLAKVDLGLDSAIYEEMKQNITGIIHSAWKVDFKMSLESFEPLIAGVRNLASLALGSPYKSPPSITFTSSMAVLSDICTSPILEEPILDPSFSVGTGYGESKWVAESLLLHCPVNANIVRVGQLCGDTRTGAWNQKEWVPNLVKTSLEIGKVPVVDEKIAWVPIDIAASALIEIQFSLSTGARVLHLVHPKPISWSSFAYSLHVSVVSWSEWVALLPEDNTLFEFFKAYEKAPVLSTKGLRQVSNTMRNMKELNQGDIERWIAEWIRNGFIR
ncbi:hypothetical protein VKT23_008439 [Stygiomarasmius scandens]|uniref:Carrier domain-containing protein n=1 Tax=Marasmiellus scandens TaxID=2682957 RepID=A0ABR1JJ01_9AGAR